MESFQERLEVLKSSVNNKSKAFTIIELTVVTGILGLLSLLVALMLTQGMKSYRHGQNEIRMQDSTAKALRDFETKSRAAEEIITANANEFVFYAYIANDTRPAPSKIRYFISGNKLVRGVISPQGAGPTFAYPSEDEVFNDVGTGILNTDEVFSYYNDHDYDYSNDATTKLAFPVNLAQIKMVRISMRVDFDTAQSPVPSEESTLVSLRNLKRNL